MSIFTQIPLFSLGFVLFISLHFFGDSFHLVNVKYIGESGTPVSMVDCKVFHSRASWIFDPATLYCIVPLEDKFRNSAKQNPRKGGISTGLEVLQYIALNQLIHQKLKIHPFQCPTYL